MITNCPHCNCPHEYDHATDDYRDAGPTPAVTVGDGTSAKHVRLHTCDECRAVIAISVLDENGGNLYTPRTEGP
jgi:hypothetical protein